MVLEDIREVEEEYKTLSTLQVLIVVGVALQPLQQRKATRTSAYHYNVRAALFHIVLSSYFLK
jgi:hypothetical protein